jgi:hypothetical protein
MRNCKGIKVLAIIKELNGIDSGFILINLKIVLGAIVAVIAW